MTESTNTNQTAYIYAVVVGFAFGWRYESFTIGIIATVTATAAIYGHYSGFWEEMGEILMPALKTAYAALRAWLQPNSTTVALDIYEVCVGKDVEAHQYIIPTLQELGSFGVYAITGGGKTSFIHSIIHQLIENCSPKDLQLAIADLKEGLDFRIYRRLPHLMLPVATNTGQAHQQINFLLEEMNRRARLFKAIPEDRICNSLADYHRLGKSLGLPRLPRIVAVIDEFQNITLENDAALNGLVKLAKEGRAFGISIICSTQLPNVEAVPTKLKSQFPSAFCGYLSNPSHYYKIVEVTKELWEPFHKNGKVAGRFIASIAGEAMIIQSIYYPKKQLEDMARQWSENQREPTWPQKFEPSKTPQHIWQGSTDEKRAMLIEWFSGFDEMPPYEDFQAVFNASKATYYNHVPALWEEVKNSAF